MPAPISPVPAWGIKLLTKGKSAKDRAKTPEEQEFDRLARNPNSMYAAAKKNIEAAKLARKAWEEREAARLAAAPPLTFAGKILDRHADPGRPNIVDRRGEYDLPPVGDRAGTLAENLPASYPELEAYRARVHEIDASKDRQAGRPERPLPPSNVPGPALSTMTDEAVAQLRKELGMK